MISGVELVVLLVIEMGWVVRLSMHVVVVMIGKWRWGEGGGGGGGGRRRRWRNESFLLSFTSFMVLKPIKHILAFDFPIVSETSSDSLNLVSSWRSDSIVVVKFFENSDLITCGCPPATALPT